ncbi:MAG: hypothetical protein GY711_26475 [bacterium]|nr:hypothetical protein [bacterium]
MSRRRRYRRRAILIAAGLLLVLTYAPTHRFEDEYLVWERDASGAMVKRGDGEFALGIDVTRSRGATTVGAERDALPDGHGGKVATRRIWFLDVSGERLLRETAVTMQSQLKDLDWVQETAYFPHTYQPLHESTLPDLFVTLELVRTSDLHLPLYHAFEHDVRVGVGRRPLRTDDDRDSFRSAAQAEFLVTVAGSSIGLKSAARRHDEATRMLVAGIDLPGMLASWRAHYGSIAGAPEDLIEEERGLPELPLPPHPERRQLYQGGFFLVHTEAMWVQEVQQDAREEVLKVRDALHRAGWRYDPFPVILRATKGSLYFEAHPTLDPEAGDEGTLILFVQDRYTAAEARDLLARRLADGPDPAAARLFLEHVFPNLRAALLEELERRPITTLDATLLDILRR